MIIYDVSGSNAVQIFFWRDDFHMKILYKRDNIQFFLLLGLKILLHFVKEFFNPRRPRVFKDV